MTVLNVRGEAYSVVRLDEGVVHGDNVDVIVLDAMACGQLDSCYIDGVGKTYALRKTIRPMRPNPLIPTCEDVLVAVSGPSGVVDEGASYLDNHDELSVVLRKSES